MTTQKKSYALPIAMMFLLFFMISFVTGLQSPMGVVIKNQFTLSNFQSQLGNFANFIAYAFMGIPAGMLLKRRGYKVTALWAIIVGLVGVSILFGSSFLSNTLSGTGVFSIYIIGAFIAGFSMCMLNTVVNPMLNTLGGGGNKGNQLIQYGGTINSIGATIVPVLIGYLMGDATKAMIADVRPALLIAMSIFALAFIVLACVEIPEPHLQAKDAPKVKDKHSPMSFRHFVLGTVAIFVYVGVEVGIPGIANLLMTQPLSMGGLAIEPTVAGSVVGVYWLLMLVGRFLGASVGAKVSSRTMLASMSGLAVIFVLLAIFCSTDVMVRVPAFQNNPTFSFSLAQVPISVMFLILCGLCTSIMWGGIFNLAVEGLGKYTAAASGVFMVMVCGGGILPLIQGFVADKVGYLGSYWVIIVAVLYMLCYALFWSKNVNKDIDVTE